MAPLVIPNFAGNQFDCSGRTRTDRRCFQGLSILETSLEAQDEGFVLLARHPNPDFLALGAVLRVQTAVFKFLAGPHATLGGEGLFASSCAATSAATLASSAAISDFWLTLVDGA